MFKSKLIFFLFLMFQLSAYPVLAQMAISIKDSGIKQEKKDAEGKTVSYSRTLTFFGGSVSRYELTCGVDLQKKNMDVSIGGVWYGSIGVLIDGKSPQNAEEPKWEVRNGRGIVDFKWNDAKAGTVRLRAVMLPGDDKILWELKILDGGQANVQLQVSTCAFPGQFGNQGGEPPNDRWVSTGIRSIRHGREPAILDLAKEWWMYCFDANGNKRGSCAMMLVPEECESAQVMYLEYNYGVYPGVAGRKGQLTLRFILWSFPEFYMPRDSAHRYLSDHGKELLEQLRKFDFENFPAKAKNISPAETNKGVHQ